MSSTPNEHPAGNETERDLDAEGYDSDIDYRNLHPRFQWCMDNKEAILELHSSKEYTKIFAVECDGCQRFFKHCMFSKKERRSWDITLCRWCQADNGIGTDRNQFEIDCHIHCNRGGKKECGRHADKTLEIPPNRRPAVEADIKDIPVPEVQFTTKKKMSQKERKALERQQREAMGP